MRSVALPAWLLMAALTAACATSQAKTKILEAPALDAPPPPARVIAPLDAEEETPPTSPEGAAKPNQPTRPAPRPAPATRETPAPGRTEPPKPEPEVVKPPDPVVEAPPPVHRLQPANEAEQEKSILNRIAAAERDLSRVDYGKLAAAVKDQYDTAKRLIAQAKDALKSRNLVFADSAAEKAAAIAASLKP